MPIPFAIPIAVDVVQFQVGTTLQAAADGTVCCRTAGTRPKAKASITGPTTVAGLDAGPTGRLTTASRRRAMNCSYTASSTMTREQAEH